MNSVLVSVIVSLVICISVMVVHINILQNKLREFLDEEEENFYKQLKDVEAIVIEVLKNRK